MVTLSKGRLIELCAKFKLAAENLKDKTRLNLTKLLFSTIEKELGKLRDEKIVPYLNDVIQAISLSVPGEKNHSDKSIEADKIKELEKEVEALKIQLRNELEDALPRLEAARGQPGVGAQTESGQLDKLKTLLRRDFRIAETVAPQGENNEEKILAILL